MEYRKGEKIYSRRFCEEFEEHLANGYSIESFAANIGVARQTIHDWIKKHEEFNEAKERGLAKCLKNFETIYIACASGQEINKGKLNTKRVRERSLHHFLTCRFPEIYGHKIQVTQNNSHSKLMELIHKKQKEKDERGND